MSTTAVSVKLSDDVKDRLTAVAKKSNRSAHYLMREAIVAYVAREERRISFAEEAEVAWRDYQETGQHLSLETIEHWAKNDLSELPPWQK
jgi:predicted transcriptional regulator